MQGWALVEQQLELLARWIPVIEGRAASLERAARSATVSNGRGDFVDEKHHELQRALVISDRLRRLRLLPHGERHVVVLEFVFLVSGAEWRRRSDPRLDGGGVAEAVGRRFANPAVVTRWDAHSQRSLRRALPRKYGQELLEAAIAAYEQVFRHDREAEDAQARGT
jgi:hypothetical protein